MSLRVAAGIRRLIDQFADLQFKKLVKLAKYLIGNFDSGVIQ